MERVARRSRVYSVDNGVPLFVVDGVGASDSQKRLAYLQAMLHTDSKGRLIDRVGMSSKGRYKPVDGGSPALKHVDFKDLHIHDVSISPGISATSIAPSDEARRKSVVDVLRRQASARALFARRSHLGADDGLLNEAASANSIATDLPLGSAQLSEERDSNASKTSDSDSEKAHDTKGIYSEGASRRRAAGARVLERMQRTKETQQTTVDDSGPSKATSAGKHSSDEEDEESMARGASNRAQLAQGADMGVDLVWDAIEWVQEREKQYGHDWQLKQLNFCHEEADVALDEQASGPGDSEQQEGEVENTEEDEKPAEEDRLNEVRLREKLLREVRDELLTEIPIPIRRSILENTIPIIEKTIKEYQSVLGSKHKMTQEAVQHLAALREQLSHYT